MVFKNTKGMFELKKNFKDAFSNEKFEERYIEECFDQYKYVVGDISSGILRLKGFNDDANGGDYFEKISSYLEKSCPFQCPFFVVRKIKNEEEYNKLSSGDDTTEIVFAPAIPVANKVAYDKENITLTSNPKESSKVVIDIQRLNSIPRKNLHITDVKVEEPVEETVVYTSSSPNFIPKENPNQYGGNKKNNNGNNNNSNNSNGGNNKNKKYHKYHNKKNRNNGNNKPNNNVQNGNK